LGKEGGGEGGREGGKEGESEEGRTERVKILLVTFIHRAKHSPTPNLPLQFTPTDRVWNGDRRLRDKYGDEVMEAFEEQTSVTPFAAILQGRQVLPADYWKEFVRLPYAIITVGTIGAYLAHPFMQAGSWTLHW